MSPARGPALRPSLPGGRISTGRRGQARLMARLHSHWAAAWRRVPGRRATTAAPGDVPGRRRR